MNKLLISVFAIISVAFLMQSVECAAVGKSDELPKTEKPIPEVQPENEEDPDCFCTFEYNPVCASNGETFANECMFECIAESPRGLRLGLFITSYGVC